MDINTYDALIRQKFQDIDEQRAEFQTEKARKMAIEQAEGMIELPIGQTLINTSLNNPALKSGLSKSIQNITGLSQEEADNLIENISDEGLAGITKTGVNIGGILKSKINNLLNLDENNDNILNNLNKVFINNKGKISEFLKNQSTNNLSDLKQNIQNLTDTKISDLSDKLNVLKENVNKKTQELQDKINTTDNEDLKNSYIQELEDHKSNSQAAIDDLTNNISITKTEGLNALKNVQSTINEKGNELLGNLKDTTSEITDNLGLDNLKDFTAFNNPLNIENITPSLNLMKESDNTINNGLSILNNIKSKISGLFSSNIEGLNLTDKVKNYTTDLQKLQNKISIPSNIKKSLNKQNQQLEQLKQQYENTNDPEEIAAIRDKITTLNNNISDLEEQKNQFINNSISDIKSNLKNKYNINDDEIEQGIEELKNPIEELGNSASEILTGGIENVGSLLLPNLIKNPVIKNATNNVMGLIQAGKGLTGSDSTIARALQLAPKQTQKIQQLAENLNQEAQGKIVEMTNIKPTIQPTEETTTAEPVGEATGAILPEGQELISEGEIKEGAQMLAKNALKQGLGDEIGETIGETAGEIAGEIGLGDLALPGIGLIAGLGTLISQTIHNIHEAREQAHISVANVSTQFGV